MRFVAFFLSLILVVSISSQAICQVRLNELLADPGIDWDGDGTVNSRGDEWLEIINVGTSAVDISSYRLGDLSGGYSWRYGFSGILDPGAAVVVFGSGALAWQSASGFPANGLSLNNSGDTVYLYRVSSVDTVVVDDYSYSSFEVLDDRSVGRYPDGQGPWLIFDGLNPYSGSTPPGGTGCNPSPGTLNGCVTPSRMVSWGQIKSSYDN